MNQVCARVCSSNPSRHCTHANAAPMLCRCVRARVHGHMRYGACCPSSNYRRTATLVGSVYICGDCVCLPMGHVKGTALSVCLQQARLGERCDLTLFLIAEGSSNRTGSIKSHGLTSATTDSASSSRVAASCIAPLAAAVEWSVMPKLQHASQPSMPRWCIRRWVRGDLRAKLRMRLAAFG
jgi:hypothetical protein